MYSSSDTLRSTVLQYADVNVKQALTYLLQALDFLYTEKNTLSLCWYRSLNAEGDYANDWWAPCTTNWVLNMQSLFIDTIKFVCNSVTHEIISHQYNCH